MVESSGAQTELPTARGTKTSKITTQCWLSWRVVKRNVSLQQLSLSAEQLALFEYIENEDTNIFVTGRAGTGKSTLLAALLLDERPGGWVLVGCAVTLSGVLVGVFDAGRSPRPQEGL